MRRTRDFQVMINLTIQQQYDPRDEEELYMEILKEKYLYRNYQGCMIYAITGIKRYTGNPVLQNHTTSGDADINIIFTVEYDDFAPGSPIFGAIVARSKTAGRFLCRKDIADSPDAKIYGTIEGPNLDVYQDRDLINGVVVTCSAPTLTDKVCVTLKVMTPENLHRPPGFVTVMGRDRRSVDTSLAKEMHAKFLAIPDDRRTKAAKLIYLYTNTPSGRIAGDILTAKMEFKENVVYKLETLPAGERGAIIVDKCPDDHKVMEMSATELHRAYLELFIREIDLVLAMIEADADQDENSIFWKTFKAQKIHPR